MSKVATLHGTASVTSVVGNLSEYRDDIRHLSVVIMWKNGDVQVCGDDKPLSTATLLAMVLQADVMGELKNE